MSDLHVKQLQAWYPMSEEEILDYAIFAPLHAAVDATITHTLIDGEGTGENLGFCLIDPPPEPTAMDRALALLDPELRRCPLYKAGPPVLYPHTWKV